MRLLRFSLLPLLAALAASLTAPALASGSDARIWSAELLPAADTTGGARGERGLAVARERRFDLIGIHWQGAGAVEFRTRSANGRFGPWRPAEAEAQDAPDPGTREASRRASWRLGSPWWSPGSVSAQVRTRGAVRRVKAWFVRSSAPRGGAPSRAIAAAGAPAIVPRSGWNASEGIVRAAPRYADGVGFAVVHHTAGQTSYSRSEAPAIVRAIQLYHVQGNGWNDIGYNALVDRFGVVYEGRRGGIDRPVIGAHALGFNTGSIGVAVLGTFSSSLPTPEARAALASYLAWRLDLAHVDPLGFVNAVSSGNPRHGEGQSTQLRVVSGHRDTGPTTCPGDAFYATLPALAREAAAIGLPKLFEPQVTGSVGGKVRFRARLSGSLPWAVRIIRPDGAEVAAGEGFGRAVDWTWDATTAAPAGYRWRIEAGADLLPAEGTLAPTIVPEPPPELAIEARSDIVAITPNGDGQGDAATIEYTISRDATVSAHVIDALGFVVAELDPLRWRRLGAHRLSFDGADIPDGGYVIRLEARAVGGLAAVAEVPVAVTRTLGRAVVSPALVTPNGDGRGDALAVRMTLSAPAAVTLRILREGAWVATPFTGRLEPGTHTLTWDGRKRIGWPRDGAFEAVVDAADEVATGRVSLPFSLDRLPPTVRVRSLSGPARIWVSEAARLSVHVNGVWRRLVIDAPGELRLGGVRRVSKLIVIAKDVAGNRSVLRRVVPVRQRQ